uniref:Uncharacterized protein n=1 Tax=Populus alba TaxID=43335 RepID=A0A4U5QP07_POPAL|nr:hypothetical protein D5086_0000076790 [Populus alba]
MALAGKFVHTPFKTINRNFTSLRKERPYCQHCRTQGHTLENCYKAGNAEPPVCSHCNVSGHMVEKCYKLHGYPPSHKLYKGRVASSFANQAVLSTSPNKEEVSEEKMVFTKEQYHHLMSLIQPQSLLTATPTANPTSFNSKNSATPSKMSDSPPTPPNISSSSSRPVITPQDVNLDNSYVSYDHIDYDTPSPSQTLRKSTRTRTAPAYLQDFHCQQAALTSDFQSMAQFQAFSSNLSIMVEPTSYSTAVKDLGFNKLVNCNQFNSWRWRSSVSTSSSTPTPDILR